MSSKYWDIKSDEGNTLAVVQNNRYVDIKFFLNWESRCRRYWDLFGEPTDLSLTSTFNNTTKTTYWHFASPPKTVRATASWAIADADGSPLVTSEGRFISYYEPVPLKITQHANSSGCVYDIIPDINIQQEYYLIADDDVLDYSSIEYTTSPLAITNYKMIPKGERIRVHVSNAFQYVYFTKHDRYIGLRTKIEFQAIPAFVSDTNNIFKQEYRKPIEVTYAVNNARCKIS